MKVVVALVTCLALAGCGGGSSASSTTTIATTPTTPTPTATVVDQSGKPLGLRIGAQLDPTALPSLPADGVQVWMDTRPRVVVLVGLDGHVYGHLDAGAMNDREIAPDGRSVIDAPQQADNQPSTQGQCVTVAGIYELCRRGVTNALVDSTTGKVLADGWPHVLGLGFTGASLSPNGRTLLASWSGECESPRAVFVPTGGGAVRTADGKSSPVRSAESYALGWASDDRAVVGFPMGACGPGLRQPGIYAMSTNGRATLIYGTRRIMTTEWLW